jgi:hypothetical protein
MITVDKSLMVVIGTLSCFILAIAIIISYTFGQENFHVKASILFLVSLNVSVLLLLFLLDSWSFWLSL